MNNDALVGSLVSSNVSGHRRSKQTTTLRHAKADSKAQALALTIALLLTACCDVMVTAPERVPKPASQIQAKLAHDLQASGDRAKRGRPYGVGL